MAATFAVVSTTLMVVGWTTDGVAPADLNTAVVGLLIPYSLTRWATGRDAVVGLGLFLLVAGTSLVTQYLVSADRIGGAAVIVTAAAVGATLRTRAAGRVEVVVMTTSLVAHGVRRIGPEAGAPQPIGRVDGTLSRRDAASRRCPRCARTASRPAPRAAASSARCFAASA